jgi:minor curlin subunit
MKIKTYIAAAVVVMSTQAGAQELSTAVYIPQMSDLQQSTMSINDIVGSMSAAVSGMPTLPRGSRGSLALISQEGLFNMASIEQTGSRNVGLIRQIGYSNNASIFQSGTGHRALVSQVGRNNVAIIRQRSR